MRITNPTIIRGYNRSLNRLAKMKDSTMKKITSTREFSRASEAPLNAAKALNVRKSLAYTTQYQENLNVADKFYTEAETSLLQVSDKMSSIRETLIGACNNGIKSVEEYNIYAQQLEQEAEKLCAVFNTDTAGRAIFGGCSDNTSPFAILKDSEGNASTVTYHGVPVNAIDDPSKFPYSEDVYIDIGLGIKIDQDTQEVDPQSALCISFNGMQVSGCGAQSGTADIDLSSIKENKNYCIDVYAGNVKKTISFTGLATQAENKQLIADKLEEAYKFEFDDGKIPVIDDQGVVTIDDGIVCIVNNEDATRTLRLTVDNDSGYTNKYKLNLDSLNEGQEYSFKVVVGDREERISFVARDTEDNTIDEVNNALAAAFTDEYGNASRFTPVVSKNEATKGVITTEGAAVKISDVKTSKTDSTFLNNNSISYGDLEKGKTYSFAVSVGTEYKKISFTATDDNDAAIQTALTAGFAGTGLNVTVTDGVISAAAGTASVSGGDSATLFTGMNLNGSLTAGDYTFDLDVGGKTVTVDFTATGVDADDRAALSEAVNRALTTTGFTASVDGTTGALSVSAKNMSLISTTPADSTSENASVFERQSIYSKNYIQLTLDAARALRNGDIEYANGCIDRIVSSGENLLIEIANLGCNEDFIEFNTERLTTREYNLDERQNDLECTSLEEQATLLKQYTALYNACLQIASEVVPNSIFNYMS